MTSGLLDSSDVCRRWNPNMPHKGWTYEGCSEVEVGTFSCEMCGNEEIRYVHHISHPEHADISVGCICASKLCNNYVDPERHEREAKNRTARLSTWLSKDWARSKNGNPRLRLKGTHTWVTVFAQGEGWNFSIAVPGENVVFGDGGYPHEDAAKRAAFSALPSAESPGGR